MCAAAVNAGFAAMPCCIRDGLYCVESVRRVDDGIRYAVMVGAMAATYGAHMVKGIERAITNRHLVIIGGFRPFDI